MSIKDIHVTQSDINNSMGHVFTVEFDGESYTTVYPEPLSALSSTFSFEDDAWAQLISDRASHPVGDAWDVDNPKQVAKILWEKLGDTPVDEDECIDESFLHFEKGTDIYEIWEWFEECFDVSVATDLQKLA